MSFPGALSRVASFMEMDFLDSLGSDRLVLIMGPGASPCLTSLQIAPLLASYEEENSVWGRWRAVWIAYWRAVMDSKTKYSLRMLQVSADCMHMGASFLDLTVMFSLSIFQPSFMGLTYPTPSRD